MADEPNTPSAAPAPNDATPAASSSAPAQPEQSEDRSWFHRLLRRPDPNVPPASAGAEETDTPGATSSSGPLTPEELERRVQAETDRREYQRRQREGFEQRKKLRDSDPYAYAEQERQLEQQGLNQAQFNQLLGTVGTTHDRVAIDPIVEALDDRERDRIMALPGAGVGLDGRKLVVQESLKALEKRWKAEGAAQAEQRLRKNQTFRKQVFAEHRGSQVDPELLPANGAVEPAGDHDVSNLLRRSLGRG